MQASVLSQQRMTLVVTETGERFTYDTLCFVSYP